MQSIMTYTDKGYDVEIFLKEDIQQNTHSYVADIKHPCGELVEGQENLPSKRNAVYWAVNKILELPFAYHHCENEYCMNNRYLKHFKRIKNAS